MNYAEVLEQLYNLRRDKNKERERPHKPILLLALFDLIEAGKDSENHFEINDQLILIWKSYFDIVKGGNDKPTPANPLYFLSGDKIWGLVARDGGGNLYKKVGSSITPSKKWLSENAKYGKLTPEIYKAINNPSRIFQLRNAIIGRYFPEQSQLLKNLSNTILTELGCSQKEGHKSRGTTETIAARDSAFRKFILEQYDSRCSACGFRLVVGDIRVVDAAHIVPWRETQNDHPSNGLALCKNHHWAMDRGIMAPGVDRKWHISNRLDSRIADHQPILELENKPLLKPLETKYMPKESYLLWRYERLK